MLETFMRRLVSVARRVDDTVSEANSNWWLLNVQGTFGVNTDSDSVLTLMLMPLFRRLLSRRLLSRHKIAQPHDTSSSSDK